MEKLVEKIIKKFKDLIQVNLKPIIIKKYIIFPEEYYENFTKEELEIVVDHIKECEKCRGLKINTKGE